jgi:hypothetical protein
VDETEVTRELTKRLNLDTDVGGLSVTDAWITHPDTEMISRVFNGKEYTTHVKEKVIKI